MHIRPLCHLSGCRVGAFEAALSDWAKGKLILGWGYGSTEISLPADGDPGGGESLTVFFPQTYLREDLGLVAFGGLRPKPNTWFPRTLNWVTTARSKAM